jgi:hypothetical protein
MWVRTRRRFGANGIVLLFFLGLMVMIVSDTHGQDGNAGITAATTQVKGYFGTASNLMLAIGGIVGLIGGIKVYQKWNSGEQDTGRVAAAWFGSCVFLVLVGTVLRAFFAI